MPPRALGCDIWPKCCCEQKLFLFYEHYARIDRLQEGEPGMSSGEVLLTGSSGLIGTSLVRDLEAKRISTISLQRKPASGAVVWNPYAVQPMSDPGRLNGIMAAVHLAGANVSGRRWSAAYKREILESRVKPTKALAALLAGLAKPPSVLVCASAVGVYGDRGDEELSEASSSGSGFLAEVCVAWEAAAQAARDAGIRVVHLRFGVVLAVQGGALKKMLPVFRLGLGGKLGNGRQWMSWVALPDVIAAIQFVIQTPELNGPVNVVAPEPVTNRQFTRSLGRAVNRPAVMPVPEIALRTVFGEMAGQTMLASQRVVRSRLTEHGFSFAFPTLVPALR
jgi:uncharacterized protein